MPFQIPDSNQIRNIQNKFIRKKYSDDLDRFEKHVQTEFSKCVKEEGCEINEIYFSFVQMPLKCIYNLNMVKDLIDNGYKVDIYEDGKVRKISITW